MSRLGDALVSNSLTQITGQIDQYFEGAIAGKQQEVERLDAQIKPLRLKRDEIKAEIDSLKLAQKTVAEAVEKTSKPKVRGEFYFRPSRTGESGGHYIESFKDGTTRCSCQAGQFGGDCWAQREVKRPFGLGSIGRRYYNAQDFDRLFNEARSKNK